MCFSESGFSENPTVSLWIHHLPLSICCFQYCFGFVSAKTSQGTVCLETLNVSTPHVPILNTIVNSSPLLTQVSAQKHHQLEVSIGQMNLTITSPMLAGSHYKLGENNSRPMGLASHKGLPPRTGSITMANQTNASNKLLHGRGGNDLLRGQIITVQRCSDRDHTLPGKLCITNLPSGKKGDRGLRALNMFMNHKHYKMEGLHTLPDLIQLEDWMIKLDLKDANLQVPIRADHQHLLQFQWDQKFTSFSVSHLGWYLPHEFSPK